MDVGIFTNLAMAAHWTFQDGMGKLIVVSWWVTWTLIVEALDE